MDIAVELRKAVSDAFPSVPIFTETVRQGFSAPCVYIRASSADRRKELGKRYRNSHSFEIRYYPAAEDADRFDEIGEALMNCCGTLPESGASGRKMSYKVTDKALSFTVSYNFCSFEEEEDRTMMETVTETISLGGSK